MSHIQRREKHEKLLWISIWLCSSSMNVSWDDSEQQIKRTLQLVYKYDKSSFNQLLES